MAFSSTWAAAAAAAAAFCADRLAVLGATEDAGAIRRQLPLVFGNNEMCAPLISSVQGAEVRVL